MREYTRGCIFNAQTGIYYTALIIFIAAKAAVSAKPPGRNAGPKDGYNLPNPAALRLTTALDIPG
jgi:hypothetical protein